MRFWAAADPGPAMVPGNRRAVRYDGREPVESPTVHHTTGIARRPRPTPARPRALRPLPITLLVAMLIATQAMVLSHELEHVAHAHEEPCALHDAAEHLAMASAPGPGPAVALLPARRPVTPVLVAPPQIPSHPSDARAPPLLP